MNQEQHEMILEVTHSSDAEEWYCPSCGRRMLISWHPQFKKVVLEAGDNYAMHSAMKGFFTSDETKKNASVDSDNTSPEIITPVEDASLAPWLAWIEKIDFNSLWNNKD